MSPYAQQNFAPITRGIGNISSALMMLPYRQQQMALMAERQRQQQQMEQETAARTGLLKQQTAGLSQDELDASNVSAYAREVAADPTDTDAQARLIGGFAKAYQKNPEGAANSLGQLFAQFQARSGSTNFSQMAALQGQAASIANNQANNAAKANLAQNKVIIAPNNSTVFNPDMTPAATAATTLAPGQQRFAPSTSITDALTPVASGVALPPKSSAVDAQQAELERQVKLEQIKNGVENGGWTPQDVAQFLKTGDTNYPPAAPHNIPPSSTAPAYSWTPGLTGGTITSALSPQAAPAAALPAAAAPTAPAAQPVVAPVQPSAAMAFNSPLDVKAAYKAGRLDRATAQQILQSQFGMQ